MALDQVRAEERALGAVLTALDPDAVALPEVAPTYESLCAMRRLVDGALVRMARRVEEAGAWARAGYPSPEAYLAAKAGTSTGQAKGALRTSRRLPDLGATDDAVREGKLSLAQTEAIADAAVHAPDAEQRLLARAGRRSLEELRDECGRAKAAADRDAAARRARIHRDRFCRTRTLPDGAAQLVYQSTSEDVAEVAAALEPFTRAAFDAARVEGRHEPHQAYTADGMLAMARAAVAGRDAETGARPVPAKVLVRVDWDALLRGYPIDGETAEIAGIGPVPVDAIRDIIATGDAFLAAVVTKGVDVVNVAHLGRRPTAAQLTGLLWRDPTCQVEGCSRIWGLENDHVVDWADSHLTLLSLLRRYCSHHHRLKTHHGWDLVDGTGKREMVPPHDPRHPRNRGAPARGPDPPGGARLA